MLAKKVPMRSIGKSDYGALVEYLTDRQDKYERLDSIPEVGQFVITEPFCTNSGPPGNELGTAFSASHLCLLTICNPLVKRYSRVCYFRVCF